MPNNTQLDPEGPSSSQPAFAIQSIARTVWKRKVSIVSVWILLSLAAVAIVHELPSIYLAEALILVDSQSIPEKYVSATVASNLEDRLATIRDQILSSAELTKIINDFDLYKKERKTLFEEEIVDLMRKDISIDFAPDLGGGAGGAQQSLPANIGKNSRLAAFRIGYQGQNPNVVAKVANRLTELYVEQNLKTREQQAAGTSDFLGTQVQEAKKHLDELEAAVSSYKLKHNGELPQQETALTAALSGLHTRLQANMDAINRTQQTKIIQQSTLGALEADEAQALAAYKAGRPVVVAPGGQPVRKASETLQERYDTLRTQYTDNFAPMVRLRKQIEDAKKEEEQQQAKKAEPGPNGEQPLEPPDLARAREQIAALKAQIAVADAELASRATEQKQILRDIDSYQVRIEHLPVREQEMAQLTRDYEMSKENYKSLLDKQTAAAMSLDMERRQQSERFTVLDRATIPEKPVKPKKGALYAGGSAAALALGLLVGFALELRNNVFLGEWELPPGTTVLARLPYIDVPIRPSEKAPPSRGNGAGRNKPVAAALAVLPCLAGLLSGGARSIIDRL